MLQVIWASEVLSSCLRHVEIPETLADPFALRFVGMSAVSTLYIAFPRPKATSTSQYRGLPLDS